MYRIFGATISSFALACDKWYPTETMLSIVYIWPIEKALIQRFQSCSNVVLQCCRSEGFILQLKNITHCFSKSFFSMVIIWLQWLCACQFEQIVCFSTECLGLICKELHPCSIFWGMRALLVDNWRVFYYTSVRSLSLRRAFLERFFNISSAISQCGPAIELYYSKRKWGKGGEKER